MRRLTDEFRKGSPSLPTDRHTVDSWRFEGECCSSQFSNSARVIGLLPGSLLEDKRPTGRLREISAIALPLFLRL